MKPEAQILNWNICILILTLNLWCFVKELREIDAFNWSPFFKLYTSVQLYCDVVKYLKTGVSSEIFVGNSKFPPPVKSLTDSALQRAPWDVSNSSRAVPRYGRAWVPIWNAHDMKYQIGCFSFKQILRYLKGGYLKYGIWNPPSYRNLSIKCAAIWKSVSADMKCTWYELSNWLLFTQTPSSKIKAMGDYC